MSDELTKAVEVWRSELSGWTFSYDQGRGVFQAAPPHDPSTPVVSAPNLADVIRLAKMRDLFPGMK